MKENLVSEVDLWIRVIMNDSHPLHLQKTFPFVPTEESVPSFLKRSSMVEGLQGSRETTKGVGSWGTRLEGACSLPLQLAACNNYQHKLMKGAPAMITEHQKETQWEVFRLCAYNRLTWSPGAVPESSSTLIALMCSHHSGTSSCFHGHSSD